MENRLEKKKLLDKSEIFEGLLVGDDVPGISTFWMTLEYYHAHGRQHLLMKAYLVLICILGATFNGQGMLSVLTVEMKYKRRIAALMNPICGCQSLFKGCIFCLNLPEYLKLLSFLKHDFLSCIPEEKKEGSKAVYNQNTEATNRYMKYAITWNVLTLLMVSTMPYIRSQWMRKTLHVGQGPLYPNKITENEYMFKWNYTPMYEIILAYEELSVVAAIFTATVYQAILILPLMAIVGHLKVLGYVLESIKGKDCSSDDLKPDKAAQDEAYYTLIKCIKDHQKIVRAGDVLAERYNLFLTFHLSTAIVVGVIAIFEFKMAETFSDAFKYFIMVGYGLLEVAIYCFCGQLLENASEEVLRQVYQCEWEEMPSRFRKAATLLMLRAKTPLSLRAGRLYRVNFETMANIEQLIYTCLTMLKQTNE